MYATVAQKCWNRKYYYLLSTFKRQSWFDYLRLLCMILHSYSSAHMYFVNLLLLVWESAGYSCILLSGFLPEKSHVYSFRVWLWELADFPHHSLISFMSYWIPFKYLILVLHLEIHFTWPKQSYFIFQVSHFSSLW